MKDVLFYYIRRNEKVKEFLAPFYKGYIYCKEYNRNKCYAIGAIKKLLEVDITQKRIWYFCVPTHSNLGDQAQACCIEKYFRKFFSDHIVFKLSNNAFDFYEEKILMILKEKIKETDLIFFQSGYTFTGIHPYENMHRKIVENFPYNKIVFLPQTVKFKNQKILENVQNFYGKYDNIYFFARDKISYDIYKSIFPEHRNVHCFPDIVTTEIGNYDFNNNERNGILLCVRNDVEKLYSFQEISLFKEKLQKIAKVSLSDTNSETKENSLKEYWKKIEETIDDYAQYQVIITDRYHGTIFALIANTPVIILKTTDHKVVTGADWFEGVYEDYVYVVNDLEEASQVAQQIVTGFEYRKLPSYFKEKYYDRLKDIIEYGELKNDNL
ncbi:polysaccharide pyruvyl transferase family protein [Phascolarctobacterium faecium]|jgi:exopolysaccharide biosynthesis predicted pyruvyltransferase EpsI|uniref:polysaccharide pyruvyl transferase family protein n=2 Tax=Phascolarctobacterium faecium TaxID=33025 RepID=UPI0025977A36|nr:polysaccharide pyruvyl transferase family protein [Phascolarctobacterium faecium]